MLASASVDNFNYNLETFFPALGIHAGLVYHIFTGNRGSMRILLEVKVQSAHISRQKDSLSFLSYNRRANKSRARTKVLEENTMHYFTKQLLAILLKLIILLATALLLSTFDMFKKAIGR